MRIGTWNLANRKPTDGHVKLLMEAKCDVWLLTEINPRWDGILRERCKLAQHITAKGLSDHDAYVVEVDVASLG